MSASAGQYYSNHSITGTIVLILTMLFLVYQYFAHKRTIHMILLWQYRKSKLRSYFHTSVI
ncbi:hypothetical protein C922_05082 [Plasmodium inui San Antonio 1]|uniref:Uncharacterized protein n=1 Tax=Plasmodium inui San Antonio 1 TaxID=1237626 RepID=W6ZZ34_9APIC|nr:hypothetical protein C922_05082 [Plasmodium inui San Antonio 1]EUD64520.1 hypothetical protein C922_05082 [Plasmodium inui San Antonio 1]